MFWQSSDFEWMQIAEPVMKLYTESTDGSYIEIKESALVWHHQDADPGFGSCQAKEMLEHLESVLANEPVAVKSGQFIVEVKPQVRLSYLFFFLVTVNFLVITLSYYNDHPIVDHNTMLNDLLWMSTTVMFMLVKYINEVIADGIGILCDAVLQLI